MSESSLSTARAPDTQIERALRNAVRKVYKRGDLENLTFKRIRKSVEERLDLEEDFFKSDASWKDKSKALIQSEVVRIQLDAHNKVKAPHPTYSPTVKTGALPTSKPVELVQKPKRQGTKRASADAKPRKKKQNTAHGDAESASEKELGMTTSSEGEAIQPERTLSTEPGTEQEINGERPYAKPKPEGQDAEHSSSDMSVLVDEEPNIRKNKKRRKLDVRSGAKKLKSSKPTSPLNCNTDTDAEEIKRLQSWLIKCGIRKMWYKELSPYDTSKEKIRHLKNMLAEAGMSGRYSKDKANQIREERELKADLEAVQEREKAWGRAEDNGQEDGGAIGKPRGRLSKGLQGLDFLNHDDGEETD
ncbi:MAG: hypothetical protein Q9163_002334 [Psora crenata]